MKAFQSGTGSSDAKVKLNSGNLVENDKSKKENEKDPVLKFKAMLPKELENVRQNLEDIKLELENIVNPFLLILHFRFLLV